MYILFVLTAVFIDQTVIYQIVKRYSSVIIGRRRNFYYNLRLTLKLNRFVRSNNNNMSEATTKDTEQKFETNFQANKNTKKNERLTNEKDSTGKISIASDGIQKEINYYEQKSQRRWDERYGHFSGKLFQQVLSEEAANAGLPADTFRYKKPYDSAKRSALNIAPSPPVPKTSCSFVGWRSAKKECSLECVGAMYHSPRNTIDVPPEPGTIPVKKQTFIYLG